MGTLNKSLSETHTWVLDRVHILTNEELHEDAYSIVQEFNEWLDPKFDDHEIYSLEYIGDGSEYDQR